MDGVAVYWRGRRGVMKHDASGFRDGGRLSVSCLGGPLVLWGMAMGAEAAQANPLGGLYSLSLVLLLACAAFYYKAAEMEDEPRLLWSGLSVLIYLVTWRVFSWGWMGCLGGQVGLLAAITAVRVLRDRRKGS